MKEMKVGNGRKLNVPHPLKEGMKVVVWIREKYLISEDTNQGIKAETWYYATLLLKKHDGYRVSIRGYETFLGFKQCILIRSCSIKDTLQPHEVLRRATKEL